MFGVRNGMVATVEEMLSMAKADLKHERFVAEKFWSEGAAYGYTEDQIRVRLTRVLVEVLRYKRMLLTERLVRVDARSRNLVAREEVRLRTWRLTRAINSTLFNLGVDEAGELALVEPW